MVKRVKTEEQKICYKQTEIKRQEKVAEEWHLPTRENELLNHVEAEANVALLCLDMLDEDLKRRIVIKKREVESLQQSILKN